MPKGLKGFQKGRIAWNKKEPIKKFCQLCNNEFYVQPSNKRLHFCSQQCYWKSLKGKSNGRKSKKLKVTSWYLKNKKFCSKRCQNIGYKGIRFSSKTEFKKGNNKEKCVNWKGGISYELYPITFDRQLKD